MWWVIRTTRSRTPAKVRKNDTDEMNMRRRGRSGMVERTRKPMRVRWSNTRSKTMTVPANASSKRAPDPGIPY
jgi:hypothetical protein